MHIGRKERRLLEGTRMKRRKDASWEHVGRDGAQDSRGRFDLQLDLELIWALLVHNPPMNHWLNY